MKKKYRLKKSIRRFIYSVIGIITGDIVGICLIFLAFSYHYRGELLIEGWKLVVKALLIVMALAPISFWGLSKSDKLSD